MGSLGRFLAICIVPAGLATGWQANADDVRNGGTLHLGELDLRLGESETRWTSAREGAIALDRNTYVFGREDTYESMLSRRGIADPQRGTTIGLGFSFPIEVGR